MEEQKEKDFDLDEYLKDEEKKLNLIYKDLLNNNEDKKAIKKFNDIVKSKINYKGLLPSTKSYEGESLLTLSKTWMIIILLKIKRGKAQQEEFLTLVNSSLTRELNDYDEYKEFFQNQCKVLFSKEEAIKKINSNPKMTRKIDDGITYDELKDYYIYLLFRPKHFQKGEYEGMSKLKKIKKDKNSIASLNNDNSTTDIEFKSGNDSMVKGNKNSRLKKKKDTITKAKKKGKNQKKNIKVENSKEEDEDEGFDAEKLQKKNKNNDEAPIDKNKRYLFINNFFNKNLDSINDQVNENGIFIKTQKKKMKISENSINIEIECILLVKLNIPNSFYDYFMFLCDYKVNELKSKEIYVDNIKIKDNNLEIIDQYVIKIKLGKTTDGQSRKIKVIQEYEKKIINYGLESLIMNAKNIYIQFLIYGEGNIQIDDISNKNFILDKELNLAYFEGKLIGEIKPEFINYSKKINYQIYRYIPEFREYESQIISNKNDNKENSIIILAIFKNINITDYGQEIFFLFKIKLINCNAGTLITTYSLGLMLDTEYSVDSVELNGKKAEYSVNNSSITIKNFGILNNQFAEICIKYKYFTNWDKRLVRKENLITLNTKYTYCKINLNIPENYIVLSSKDLFQKSSNYNNRYFYNGISKEEKLHEYFTFCYKKATWDIYKEFTLSSQNIIRECTFEMNRLYKGGNLKINKFEIINNNAEFIDDEIKDQYIFNFNDLKTNLTSIAFKLNVENTTSNYKFEEKPELITKIPEEDLLFFKSLSNQILQQNQTNIPIYKKLGKWVHDYLNYNLNFKGKKINAREIYNMKTGVCDHFTLLYNTLLISQGIEAIKVSGYALELTENNILKENEFNKSNSNVMNTLSNSTHAWTLAKIDGEWVPLDATWNMFEKNVPITHIFEYYGNGLFSLNYIYGNQIEYKITEEYIKYINN